MTSKLEALRQKLKEQEQKRSGNAPGFDNAIFAFWNMEEGGCSTVRFLEDGNPDNAFFWKEKNVIRMPFNGIKGDPDSKKIIVEVPCIEMFGDTCPVHTELRLMFKDKSLEDLARQYWKKRSYIFQGFVQSTDLVEEDEPESLIRRFVLGPQLYKLVESVLLDPDISELPTDHVNGLDFKIVKTMKGKYSDYSTSQWARRESSLTDDQLAEIEKHGLADLSDFLPTRPTADQLGIIMEMFEASLEEEPYDPVRWGNHYRPKGYQMDTGSAGDKASTVRPEQKTEEKDEEVEEPVSEPVSESKPTSEPVTGDKEKESSGSGAEDILAMLRKKRQQQD